MRCLPHLQPVLRSTAEEAGGWAEEEAEGAEEEEEEEDDDDDDKSCAVLCNVNGISRQPSCIETGQFGWTEFAQ